MKIKVLNRHSYSLTSYTNYRLSESLDSTIVNLKSLYDDYAIFQYKFKTCTRTRLYNVHGSNSALWTTSITLKTKTKMMMIIKAQHKRNSESEIRNMCLKSQISKYLISDTLWILDSRWGFSSLDVLYVSMEKERGE